MTPATIFSNLSLIVVPMWLLLVFAPNWKYTRLLINLKLVPMLLAFIYAIFIVKALWTNGMMDFGNLATVMELFKDEGNVLAGWIHYLAFDLFLGIWMVEKNVKLKIHQALMAPILIATLMFGPIGFLCFMFVKFYRENAYISSEEVS